jgi:hypothetical protein
VPEKPKEHLELTAKMKFELTPHAGAGPVKLGMSRKDIVNILGAPEYSTEKSTLVFQDLTIPIPSKDGYFNNELQITFDENGKADFIEFSGRGAKHTTVCFNGVNVFRTSAPDLLRIINEITKTEYDKDEQEIPYSYVFRDLDLAVWRQVIPDMDESQNIIPESDDGRYFWTIGIGIKGYYNND